MADENTHPAESGADASAAGQTNGADGATSSATPGPDVQAQLTQLQQDNARLRGQLEALEPYVQFGTPAQPAQTPDQQVPDEDLDPEERAQRDAKRLRDAVNSVAQQSNERYGKLEERLFFAENPDLKDHRDIVLVQFQRTSSRLSVEERLAQAAQNTREYIKGIEKRAEDRVHAENKKKTAAAAATDGVMGGGSTPPPAKQDDAGWQKDADGGYSDYSAERRAQQSAMYDGTPTK
jgi:hypothetical protein